MTKSDEEKVRWYMAGWRDEREEIHYREVRVDDEFYYKLGRSHYIFEEEEKCDDVLRYNTDSSDFIQFINQAEELL